MISPPEKVLYEVSVEVEPALSGRFADYMTAVHIPEVVGTGCFTGAAFATNGEGRFRTSYRADRAEDLERYLRDHADELRRDFIEHFPTGVRVSRETWRELRRWPD